MADIKAMSRNEILAVSEGASCRAAARGRGGSVVIKGDQSPCHRQLDAGLCHQSA